MISRTPASPPHSVTTHAVSLPQQESAVVMEAAEAAGFGFRRYSSLDGLLDTAAPSSTGCVMICGGLETARDAAALNRLRAHFLTMPFVVLLESDSAASAVSLMQQGAFSVLTRATDHEGLLRTITAAADLSLRSQTTFDAGRDASARMQEATVKEREVLELIMAGRKNKEIATALGITVRAVEDRRFRLMKKVRVASVAELVATAVRARLHDEGFFRTTRTRQTVSAGPRPCLKGIEVWTPSEDDSYLVLSQSCYRDASVFGDASRDITFRRGEGLPGKIWDQRAPAFLKELMTTEFVRTGIASAAGMTTAIGFPVFCDARVQAVVLFLLDSRDQLKAAFESWRYEMSTSAFHLAGGTYINCEKLRRLSGFLALPIGQGLAGTAAEQRLPYVGSRFADDANAIRGVALAAEQLVSGVVLPLTDSGTSVPDMFLLFNSESTPLFSLLQVWKPTADKSDLMLAMEYVDGVPSLSSQTAAVSQSASRGIAGLAWRDRTPVVLDAASAGGTVVCSQQTIDPTVGLAIPTIINGEVIAVTVMVSVGI